MISRLLLRADEAAALLGLSLRALYRFAAEEKIPPEVVVRLGRSVRFSKPRLLAWLGSTNGDELAEEGPRE
jgi:excisionase family DNA binding protein